MGTKILLAGGETVQMMEVLRKCKTRFILVSYFYMRQKWKGTDRDLLDYFQQFEFVLLDSGAFTMFNKPGITYNDMERYAYEYAEFIERMKSGISAAVELDLYEIPTVGLRSHDIRRDVLEKSGVPIVPVYHGDLMHINKQTKKDWEEFCTNYKYVGIASRMWEKGPAQLAGLNMIARKHNAVTHGFGITRQDFIRNSMFFTVDSTAWTNGQRFGTHYVFEGTKLRIYSNLYKDRARKRHMRRWEREGFDLTGLLQDKTEPFVMLNCHEWTRFQDFVFNQSNRDYWEPELEVNPAREGKKVVVKKKISAPEEESMEEVGGDDIPFEEDFPEILGEVLDGEEAQEASTEVVVSEVQAPDGDNSIMTLEGLFEVSAGEDYVFRDKLQKKTWKARFNVTDFGIEELHLDAGTGEWVVAHKIYKDISQKGVEKNDVLYQNHLVHCFSRGLMSVKKVSDMKSSGALALRTEALPMAEAFVGQLLKCEDCYLTDRCHAFSAGQTCKFSVPSSVQNAGDLAGHLQRMMAIQFDRVYKGAMIEKMDGGVMDKTVSDEIMRTFNMAKELRDIFSPPKEEIVIKATGKQSSGGVLQALFGAGDKKNDSN